METGKKKKIVLMFPGQGSQYLGMGMDFMAEHKKYLEYMDLAGEILGKDLLSIIKDENNMGGLLDDTRYSQIAIFALSSAIGDYLVNECIDKNAISSVIGHSLGDYSALYQCGVFDYKEGSNLVVYRGELMGRYAGDKMAMAAVIGLDSDVISGILNNYRDSVFIANYNDPSQIVISGLKEDVLRASEEIKAAGAKRVILLKVSIASHCPLMRDAAKELKAYLDKNLDGIKNVKELRFTFFSSTEVREVGNSSITATLVEQLISPVRWAASIETLLKKGTEVFIEVGPGKILSGLVKRISQQTGYDEINIHNTGSLSDIDHLLNFLGSNGLIA